MKYICTLLSCIFLLSSCASTYFYSTIKSLNDDTFQTEDGDFITENDSLLVAYWFNGRNAPIYINVYNKSETPLYVDWTKSSIIVDDVASSYNNNVYNMSKQPEENTHQNIYVDGGNVSINSYTDYIVKPENISFIPPHSRVTFNTMHLANFEYSNLSDKYFKNARLASRDGEVYKVKLLTFSEENTPLRFRSYLTLYKKQDSPFPIEHEFYISNLIKTKDIDPENLPDNFFNRGDIFFIEKQSKNKGVGEALLGTTLVLGLFVLDAAITNSYYDDGY